MRKITYFIVALAMCVLPCSCSLEEETSTEIEKKNYLNNASEAENVLLGVYRTNVEDAMYAYHLSILFIMGTDIAQVEGSTTENWRIIPTNAFPTTQSEIQQTWAALYKGIYRANDFLEQISRKINTYNNTDKQRATIYIAEARALRAMYYFELVRRFGNIVLMRTTAESSQAPATYTQVAPEKVYEFIEEDLLFASDVLPYASDDMYRTNNEYRFSKGAALGLLAKVYATWAGYPINDTSKWEQAAKTASILVNSGKHGLLSNYEQLWKNTCNGIWNPTESLIEVSFYSPTVSGNSDPVSRLSLIHI